MARTLRVSIEIEVLARVDRDVVLATAATCATYAGSSRIEGVVLLCPGLLSVREATVVVPSKELRRARVRLLSNDRVS